MCSPTDPDHGRGTAGTLARRLAPLLTAAAALALASPAAAQGEGRWVVRGYGVWLSPAGDEVTTVQPEPGGDVRTTHGVSEAGTGFGAGLERRWGRLGAELAVHLADLDHDFRAVAGAATLTDREPVGTIVYSLGVNWHLRPGRRADLSLGAFVAQTTFDDVVFLTEAGRRDKLSFDDDYGFGAKVGLDLPLGDGGWRAAGELRYLVTILESEVAGRDLALDPLIVSVGVGYSF